MQISIDPTGGALKVTGSLHVSEAEGLRQMLGQQLADRAELALDLSGVDACDTACLQLLFAARTSAIRQQKQLRIVSLSDTILETAKALGMPLELLSCSAVSGSDAPQKRGQNGAE